VKVTTSDKCRDDEHLHRSGKFSFKLSPTFFPMRSYKILKKHSNTASIILKNADHVPE